MSVILEHADWPVWLGDIEGDPASLLHSAPHGTLRGWPANRRVGSPRNNGLELLKPLAEGMSGRGRPQSERGATELTFEEFDSIKIDHFCSKGLSDKTSLTAAGWEFRNRIN